MLLNIAHSGAIPLQPVTASGGPRARFVHLVRGDHRPVSRISAHGRRMSLLKVIGMPIMRVHRQVRIDPELGPRL
jgi:hypothetical protein